MIPTLRCTSQFWGENPMQLLFLAKITIGCRIKYIELVSTSAFLHVKLALCCAH